MNYYSLYFGNLRIKPRLNKNYYNEVSFMRMYEVVLTGGLVLYTAVS